MRGHVGAADARALSGAATWLKEGEEAKPELTREAYLEQQRDQFGLARPEDPEQEWAMRRLAGGARGGRDGRKEFEAQERAEWTRAGGREAEELAQREAWAEAEAARQKPGAGGQERPSVSGPAAAPPAAAAAAAPPSGPAAARADASSSAPADELADDFNAFAYWRRPVGPAPSMGN